MKTRLKSVSTIMSMNSNAAEKIQPMFKDGDDDGGGEDVTEFNIKIASNGFILTIMDEINGLELVEVHKTIDEVFDSIRKSI